MVFLIMDRTMKEHECPWPTYHIETPQRLEAIIRRFEETGLSTDPHIKNIPTRLASKDEIGIVHTARYIEDIENSDNLTTEQQEELCAKYEDIYVNKQSWKCARMAAGASIDLIQRVLEERENGLALVRPPGHHAMPDEGCGFCIFNNVAIAAKHARKFGAARVLIVDFDVHAGQGTQECIADDEHIRLISIHRYENGNFWPNLEQSGLFHKFRNTLNVPLNGIGFNDSDYLTIFTYLVIPLIFDWKPEIIIVSCGFDAAIGDPEGFMNLTPAGYATMIKMLQNTNIPVAAILEGGYFLESIASDAEWVLRTLLGQAVPKIDIQKVDERLVPVLIEIFKSCRDDFPTFRELEKVIKVTEIDDKKDRDFFGSRTVCAPYETRGLYEPFNEEKINEFKEKLSEIERFYRNIECYEDIKLIKPLESNDREEFVIRDNILYTNNFLVAVLVGFSHNPLLQIPESVNGITIENVENIENFLML